ncbi:hypothetical protein [Alkalibacillus salilacus]|uniref:F0F1-type ATP synthase assembly protein I n=1 Tax=Alkalibacillus salilacus TaxID=284582 RepID=A0ABT9VBK4_9BACI|nr:hypothetical protein [Alkalibacillus salilacus]MDQ0158353.1 F0F1-type ATP synthase assembly protein I [Alkalibacillus salilacus]
MKIIGFTLIVVGVIGILLSMMMFGDIGIAAFIGSLSALLSGIGFVQVNKSLSKNYVPEN